MIRPTELNRWKSPTQCDLLERNQRLIDALNFSRLSVKPITDSAASVAADFRAESVTGSHFMCWFLPILHQHSGVGAGGYRGVTTPWPPTFSLSVTSSSTQKSSSSSIKGKQITAVFLMQLWFTGFLKGSFFTFLLTLSGTVCCLGLP